MKLTHWVDKQHKESVLMGNGQFSDVQGFLKPIGFWLSVDNSWEEWLKGNWDEWTKGKVCLNAELSKDINLFIISSKEQFLKDFKRISGREYPSLMSSQEATNLFHQKLKELYDGIWLKAEVFYRHRLDFDMMYFYFWDCESICVWDKDKIKFVEKGIKDENS